MMQLLDQPATSLYYCYFTLFYLKALKEVERGKGKKGAYSALLLNSRDHRLSACRVELLYLFQDFLYNQSTKNSSHLEYIFKHIKSKMNKGLID